MNANTLYAALLTAVETGSAVYVPGTTYSDTLDGVTVDQVNKLVQTVELICKVKTILVSIEGFNSVDMSVPTGTLSGKLREKFEDIKNTLTANSSDGIDVTSHFWSGFGGELYQHATEIVACIALLSFAPGWAMQIHSLLPNMAAVLNVNSFNLQQSFANQQPFFGSGNQFAQPQYQGPQPGYGNNYHQSTDR